MLRIPHCLDNRLTVNCEILEREREREKRERGDGNIIFYLKVPRQCPLVLLIGVRLEFRVKLTFLFKLLKLEGLH
jgi:hypothetical protein